MPYRYALAEHGTTFATRPFGRELRTDLLQKAVGHRIVDLDFSGVLSASHSFADEFVARLAEESENGDIDFEVAISGASPDVDRSVRKAVDRRDARLAHLV
jgi:hypothetical protein